MTTSTKTKDVEPETPVEDTTPEQAETPESTDNAAPEPEVETEEKPKRLTAVERLAKQLEDAKQAAAKKAGNKLVKANEELEKATTDAARANARLAAAQQEVNDLQAQAGGIDPIVAATTAAALEAEQQANES